MARAARHDVAVLHVRAPALRVRAPVLLSRTFDPIVPNAHRRNFAARGFFVQIFLAFGSPIWIRRGEAGMLRN